MDSATILVLLLSACVMALLVWFEINSRRNDPKMEAKSTLAHTQSGPGNVFKKKS